jgi:peptidyl-prolyl cis-trans isomerase B (cyclophilin B)
MPRVTATIALLVSLLAAPEAPEITVPTGREIVLDGEVGADEWADAAVAEHPHPNGGTVRVRYKRTGPWLAVAADGDRSYAGEMLWIYTRDASIAWSVQLLLPLGQPAFPAAIWRRGPPAVLFGQEPSPAECPRACLVRTRVDAMRGWSVEYLVRMTALGIGRADPREFFGLFRLVLPQPGKTEEIFFLPEGVNPAQLEQYGRLVSPDGWGRDERWPPVTAAQSREFDDNELLRRLFNEHQQITTRGRTDELVIGAAVGQRSGGAIADLRTRIDGARSRNPDLPAWRFYLARLLHESNLFPEAHRVIEEIPVPLRGLEAYALLRAEHFLDIEEFAEAKAIAEQHPELHDMDEIGKLAGISLRRWGEELRAIARDKRKTQKNPRIEIVVAGRGSIVCELFEDDAPNAVRSYLALMASGFYEGLAFSEVVGGAFARTGDPRSRTGEAVGRDGPGFSIAPDACERPILRGYLSTVRQEKGLFHGSQFLIAAVPLMREPRQTIAFGRVVKGLELADTLDFGDRIERIRILSKRDHSYDPASARVTR